MPSEHRLEVVCRCRQTCARSMRPARNALRVNSPGRAGRAPSSTHAASTRRLQMLPPWQCSSTTSSRVYDRGFSMGSTSACAARERRGEMVQDGSDGSRGWCREDGRGEDTMLGDGWNERNGEVRTAGGRACGVVQWYGAIDCLMMDRLKARLTALIRKQGKKNPKP
eukprot:1189128-Prorocentrum_minimum.AAC.1